MTNAMDQLFVNFGLEILKKVPGRVSTEVDARYESMMPVTYSRDRNMALNDPRCVSGCPLIKRRWCLAPGGSSLSTRRPGSVRSGSSSSSPPRGRAFRPDGECSPPTSHYHTIMCMHHIIRTRIKDSKNPLREILNKLKHI